MKYCRHCGKEIMDEAVICVGCGCPTGVEAYQQGTGSKSYTASNSKTLLATLSNKLEINAIIWIILGALQIIGGIVLAIVLEFYYAFFISLVGVFNIVSSVKDIKYSKEIFTNPVGIVKKYEPLTEAIITLVYNLVFGAVIGVVGAIYYLLGIRGFVVQNSAGFKRLEDEYLKKAEAKRLKEAADMKNANDVAEEKCFVEREPISNPRSRIPRKAPRCGQLEIICPVCKEKQASTNNQCVRCGQVFINKQPNIPYWCGNCGNEGPFESSCTECGSSVRILNN